MTKKQERYLFGVEGMKIDLGGIAKRIYLIQNYGHLQRQWNHKWISESWRKCAGTRTKTDGTKWKIAVQSPDDTEDYLGILSVQDKAVITSGGIRTVF